MFVRSKYYNVHLYGIGTGNIISVGLRDLGLEPGTILDSTLWLMEEIDCLDEDV